MNPRHRLMRPCWNHLQSILHRFILGNNVTIIPWLLGRESNPRHRLMRPCWNHLQSTLHRIQFCIGLATAWLRTGSNRQPFALQANALPIELQNRNPVFMPDYEWRRRKSNPPKIRARDFRHLGTCAPIVCLQYILFSLFCQIRRFSVRLAGLEPTTFSV